MYSRNALTYQLAAAEGATHLGLTVLVYDAIARDLVKAGESLRGGQIEQRCAHSKHALLLLAHLENWVDLLDDAALSDSLRVLYGYLRNRMILLQSASNPGDFLDLAALVVGVRATWQAKEHQAHGETSKASYRTDSDPTTMHASAAKPFSLRA